jgi:hypothetical protein
MSRPLRSSSEKYSSIDGAPSGAVTDYVEGSKAAAASPLLSGIGDGDWIKMKNCQRNFKFFSSSTYTSGARMIKVVLGDTEKMLQWRSGIFRSIRILPKMLGSSSSDELDVTRVIDATVISIDELVFLIFPSEPSGLVSLETDLVDINGIADDWRLETQLDGIFRGWNPVFKHFDVDVLHDFH